MTDRQKIMMEDEIHAIQKKMDEAQRFMEADNFWGNYELAERWSRCVDDESCRLNGIRIALAVLGYGIAWQDDKQVIISTGA